MSDGEYPIVELIREARQHIAACEGRLRRTAALVGRRRSALAKARGRLEALLGELVDPGSSFPLLAGKLEPVPVPGLQGTQESAGGAEASPGGTYVRRASGPCGGARKPRPATA
jgi:hypothetical protein